MECMCAGRGKKEKVKEGTIISEGSLMEKYAFLFLPKRAAVCTILEVQLTKVSKVRTLGKGKFWSHLTPRSAGKWGGLLVSDNSWPKKKKKGKQPKKNVSQNKPQQNTSQMTAMV
jgi:hypothetical protein